jgi:hypothetical protein
MLRLRTTLALVVLVAPAVANGQTDPALWRFVYPNAKALISIDWGRIRQSPAGAAIREKFLTAGGPAAAIPGLELLNDMDRILLSSPGGQSPGGQSPGRQSPGNQSSGNQSSGNQTPGDSEQLPVLIAMHGHFDRAKVREIFAHFGAKPQAYNSFQVYRPQGKQVKDMACVQFDAETLLFGDTESIFAALDRNQFGPPGAQQAPAAGSMLARAAQMEANYDFWLIMDATEILSNDSVAELFQGSEWASDARGFEAGVSLRAGLAADITVSFSSDATAKRMTTELTRMLNLAAKDKSAGAQMQEIAKKLKFIADGTSTKISLRLTQAELEKSAQAFAAGQKASAKLAAAQGAASNATRTLTPIPVPAKPPVIRIEGLDDGPREIPYPGAQH